MNRTLRLANKFAAILQGPEYLDMQEGSFGPSAPDPIHGGVPGKDVTGRQLHPGDYALKIYYTDLVPNESNVRFTFANENGEYHKVINKTNVTEYSKYTGAMTTGEPVTINGEIFTEITAENIHDKLFFVMDVSLPKSVYEAENFEMLINGQPFTRGLQPKLNKGDTIIFNGELPKVLNKGVFAHNPDTAVDPELTNNLVLEPGKEYEIGAVTTGVASVPSRAIPGEITATSPELLKEVNKIKGKIENKLEKAPDDSGYKRLLNVAAELVKKLSAGNELLQAEEMVVAFKEEIKRDTAARTKSQKSYERYTVKLVNVENGSDRKDLDLESPPAKKENGKYVPIKHDGKIYRVLSVEPIAKFLMGPKPVEKKAPKKPTKPKRTDEEKAKAKADAKKKKDSDKKSQSKKPMNQRASGKNKKAGLDDLLNIFVKLS